MNPLTIPSLTGLCRLLVLLAAWPTPTTRATPPPPVPETPIPITHVDVLVLHTALARDAAGGSSQLEGAVIDAFNEANAMHDRSQTGVRLNPVGLIQAGYSDSGDLLTDIQALQGFASTLRADHRADLVVLIVEHEEQDNNGLAGPGRPGPTGNRNAAFITIRRATPVGLGMAIANRTAFLMGCGANRPLDGSLSGANAFPHSRAHVFDVDGVTFGTVMSDFAAMRIPHFSNPAVLYRGAPTGVPAGEPGEADNAATLRTLAPLVADYERCTNRVEFAVRTVQTSETSGTLQLRLLRSGPIPTTTAQLRASAVPGTAKSGVDFAFTNSIVTFAPGQSEATLHASILDNDSADGPRSFRIRLHAASPGTGVGWSSDVTISIADDDAPFSFEATTLAVRESSPPVPARILRSGSLNTQTTILLAPDSSHEPEPGLSAVSPSGTPMPWPVPVTFPPGESTAEVLLTATPDDQPAADRPLRLGLSLDATSTNIPGVTLEVWIHDDDRQTRWADVPQPPKPSQPHLGPVLTLANGGYLACQTPSPGAAITLFRAQPGGTIDPSFHEVRFQEAADPEAGLRFGRVAGIIAQPDGRLLVAGYFGAVNATPIRNLVRLLPNGDVDPSFQTGFGFAGPVLAVCLQPDGRILAVGEFTHVDGVRRHGAARLHPDGSLDESFYQEFHSGPGVSLTSVALQGDSILIGGRFERVGTANIANLARLHSDGSVDTRFTTGVSGTVHGIRMLPGGEFFAFGSFQNPRRWAGRFRANGTAEVRHRFAGLNGPVADLIPLANGQALLCGSFTGTAGTTPGFALFHPDGSTNPGLGTQLARFSDVRAVIPSPDGHATLVGRLAVPGETENHHRLQFHGLSWTPELRQPQASPDGGFILQALTFQGLRHTLEASSDLKQWDVLESRDALGTTETFHHPHSHNPRFFRLRIAPSQDPTP